MSFIEEMDQLLVGRIAFPAINYLLNRRDVFTGYRELLATEHYSKDALRELQFQKLSTVLRHAYGNCPFYTRRFKETGLAPEDIKTLEDLRLIPPLERRDVIEHRLELLDTRYRDSVAAADQADHSSGSPIFFARFRKFGLIRNTSTGSTGTPTVFYEDGSTTALNWVHEQRLKHWFGLRPGVREARMKGISTHYAANSKLRSAREFLWNQAVLPGVFLSDREYEYIVQKMRKFKPRVLWGATPALTGLARYMQRADQDLSPCHLDLVISWAAPLYEHEKELVSDVFESQVTNIYGSREVGHVAMTCPYGSIHINQENYLVEVEGAAREGEKAGPGEVLVTPLNESPMPFLRYRIGDLAVMGGNDCLCGRSLGTLKKILGRIGEIIITKEGRLIEPTFWCHAFMTGRLSQDVERFQVVYRRADCIRIRIVPRPGYSGETEAELRRHVDESFPAGTQIEFEYVSDIKPQPSGKYGIVVNEINQEEERLLDVLDQ